MDVNYNSVESIINGFDRILSTSSSIPATPIPSPLILVGAPKRSGMSAIKTASRIIARKAEAGLPVGALPDGSINPDELMERIRAEEYIKMLIEDAVVNVAIAPGVTVYAAGGGPTSGPVTVMGSTTVIGSGYGVIR